MEKCVSTKDRIIDTAIELFNRHGAHSTTTNHIADAMGISPGNLYYHFNNKEEIIRHIFKRIVVDFDAVWIMPEGHIPGLSDVLHVFMETSNLYYKYSFFYLEIASLLARDAELKDAYQKNHDQRFRQQEEFFSWLIQQGFMRNMESSDELYAHITNGWIISDFWLTYLYSSGREITLENIRQNLYQVIFMVRPLLTDDARTRIDRAMKDFPVPVQFREKS